MRGGRNLTIATGLCIAACVGDDYSLGGFRTLSGGSGGISHEGGESGLPTGGSGNTGGDGGEATGGRATGGRATGGTGGGDSGGVPSDGGAGGDGGGGDSGSTGGAGNTGGAAGSGGSGGTGGSGGSGGAGGGGGTGGGAATGATFVGTISNYTFASGSNVVTLVFGDGWPASSAGTVVFGVPGFEPPPTPVEGMTSSRQSGLVYEGFTYPMTGDLTVRQGRLVFEIRQGDIWAAACAEQTVLANPDAPSGFSCVPQGAVDFSPDGNCAVDGQPFSCDAVALCAFLGACVCSASGCVADPSQSIRIELTLAGDSLAGTARDVPPGATNPLQLTRR